jgi:vitellogenic carboxypeptidase-like protein
LKAKKQVWSVGGQVAGYARSFSSLTQLIVIGAGHLVPYNQPKNSQDMIARFIEDSTWS